MPTRVALVTGAAQGIGLAVADRLVADRFRVVLLDRDDSVHALAAGYPDGMAEGVRLDLLDLDLVTGACSHLLARHGSIDVLVNNAGIHPKLDGGAMRYDRTTTESWQQVIDLNLTVPFILCRELMPGMCAQGWGRVINMSSRAGRTVSPLASPSYAASKAGILGLSRTLATQVAEAGVTVNCVAPGPIETPLSESASAVRRHSLVDTVPMRRYGTVSEVADVVSFLASDAASYITGAILDVNGGSHMP